MTGPEDSERPSGITEFNEIAEGVSDALVEMDGEFRLLYLNGAAERFAGRTRNELYGKTLWEVFPELLGTPADTALRRCASQGIPESIESWHEGARRWYRVNMTPRRAGGVIVWFRDITEFKVAEQCAAARKAAEEHLRLSEERFRVALRDSGICVWQQDSELRYTWYYNTAAAVLESEIVGKTDEALFPAPEAARLMELGRNVIETGAGLKGYIQLTSRGQQRDFMYTLEALRDASGKVAGITGASVDVTEQKAFERGLLEAQKLDSIGLLAAGIAHDFNNLLVGIIGNASLAADMLPQDSPVVELLRTVLSSGERAAHLTRQILAYSGQGRFIIEKIDLSELVRDMSGLLQSSVRDGTRFVLDLAPDLGRIEADAPQMQQLVMNLVLNAGEAIGEDPGVLMVRTRAVTIPGPGQRKSAAGAGLPPGRYASLEIRDTGSGMDEQTKARIFEPFFTTRSVGRGLGLPAALGIVRGHKGAIEVTSKPGKGTTVRVLLPLAGD